MPTESRKIALNLRYATELGYGPELFESSALDGNFLERVTAAQRRLNIEPDGVCGPTTYKARLDEQYELARSSLAGLAGATLVRQAGALAINRAKRAWLDDVIDPPDEASTWETSRKRIDQWIRSTAGLNWTWESPYARNGDYEWCGAFASHAWGSVGLALRWRQYFFSSTYRLDRWAQYMPFDTHENPRPATDLRKYRRLDENSGPLDAFFGSGVSDLDNDDPQPGDILLVGGEKTGYGKHVTLVEGYDPSSGIFTTLEGNATGKGPRGQRLHGVVRATRTVGLARGVAPSTYHARRLIRPSSRDLA